MKKSELIKVLKERVGGKYPSPETRKAIPAIVSECFSIINEELQKGNEINLGNLGRFRVKELKKEGEESGLKVIRFIPTKKK